MTTTTIPTSWATAISATLHCLTGCAIGEVLGMVLGTWWGWGDWATVVLAVALAFFFGYLLTYTSVRRQGASRREGVRLALAADTVSIATMEIVDNAIILVIPGALMAGLLSFLFWGSLAVSLVIAFVVTVPVNHWLISRGRGHAAVHHLHGHEAGHQDHADHPDHDDHVDPGHDHAGHEDHAGRPEPPSRARDRR